MMMMAPAGAEIMSVLLMVLLAACGIGSLVCWIIVLIKIFGESVGLGILGIVCGLFAFIYGWVKCAEYGIQKVMFVWTAFFGVSILLQVITMVLIGGRAVGQRMAP